MTNDMFHVKHIGADRHFKGFLRRPHVVKRRLGCFTWNNILINHPADWFKCDKDDLLDAISSSTCFTWNIRQPARASINVSRETIDDPMPEQAL
jgi:hypothetical protein